MSIIGACKSKANPLTGSPLLETLQIGCQGRVEPSANLRKVDENDRKHHLPNTGVFVPWWMVTGRLDDSGRRLLGLTPDASGGSKHGRYMYLREDRLTLWMIMNEEFCVVGDERGELQWSLSRSIDQRN